MKWSEIVIGSACPVVPPGASGGLPASGRLLPSPPPGITDLGSCELHPKDSDTAPTTEATLHLHVVHMTPSAVVNLDLDSTRWAQPASGQCSAPKNGPVFRLARQ